MAEDGNFKKSVLDKLKDIERINWVDVRPLIRDYVEGIYGIHTKIRELVHPDSIEWESALDHVIENFQDKFGKEIPLAGLSIALVESDGRQIETKTIHKGAIERRQVLEKKNKQFVNLHKRFASNTIMTDDV